MPSPPTTSADHPARLTRDSPMLHLTSSRRLAALPSGVFTDLASLRKQALLRGMSVIDLSVGSPDLPPTPAVVDALSTGVLDAHKFGYTLGAIDGFNEAVADFYHRRYGVELEARAEVLQLMGSQDGLAHLAMALIDPGDVVLVPDPGYPIYAASITLAGGIVHPLPLRAENHFFPVLDSISPDVLRQARMMILSYPGNPVTALATVEFFAEVVAFARRHEILLVHDFAYSELVFDGVRAPSLLSIPGAKEVAVEFNSFSKTFNMAGCRIGYLTGHSGAVNALRALKSHIDYGVFQPIQEAAIAALHSDFTELSAQALVYQRRRDALVSGLRAGGWDVTPSPATMFCWVRLPLGWQSHAFAMQLLEQTGVVVTPGDAFGQEGEGYVRIAFVQPESVLAEAARKMTTFSVLPVN